MQWSFSPVLLFQLSHWIHLLFPKKLHRHLQRTLGYLEESQYLNIEWLDFVKLLVKVIFILLFKLVWELVFFLHNYKLTNMPLYFF